MACASAPELRLRRVVLYQNGVAYFERTGHVAPDGLRLQLAAHEVDDALTTLTVLDPSRPDGAPAPSMVLPEGREGTQELLVELGPGARPVTVAYSAPTSAWRASYRIVLPEARGAEDAFFQAWAIVDNTSAEDWRGVDLTLATDAPLSFAVDLRTPRLVERPNVTGHHAPPIAFGPVRAEHSTRTTGGLDHNGVGDGVVPDTDHDGILDVEDRCPDDPEAYNGSGDDDGCPDRGFVVITDSSIRILEQVYFTMDSPSLAPTTGPILDAIAATLRANPSVGRVEIEGHADVNEERPWWLSAERAAAVRAALVARGIADGRLAVRAEGESRPIAPPPNERNRRVGFHLVEQPAAAESAPAGVRAASLARSAATTPLPSVAGGGTRFPVTRSVSVPAGRSVMVSLLHRPARGEDVLLYRVDPAVPTSDAHPFRAARLENRSGVDLVPGPVSLFAHGELVGEGLLDALRAGENAFVPYALDTSTHLARESSTRSEPEALVSLIDGVATLARRQVVRTRYLVAPGQRVPGRIFVVHATTPAHAPRDLPPGTETRPGVLLLPLGIEPGRDAALAVEEQRSLPMTIDLRLDLETVLDPYLDGADLDPADRARIAQLLEERAALIRVREESALLAQQLEAAAARSAELRRGVEALDERAGRSSSEIRRRLAARLEDAARHGETVAESLATLRAREVEARARLRDAARGLRIEAR